MKLKEIAERIGAHLRRFELDKSINEEVFRTNSRGQESRLHPYYNAGAWASGRYVGVVYVSYQGASNLTKAEAVRYLDWLDAGNVGKHYGALKDGPTA